jgi:hypothetical protein
MAASKGLESFFVVFDVIGLEALVSIVNVHIIVRDKEVAAFLLGAPRPDLDIAGLGGVEGSLLRGGYRQRRSAKRIKERRKEQ